MSDGPQDASAAMSVESLSGTVVELLRQLPGLPRRIQVTSGSSSVEVEWPEHPAGSPPTVVPAPVPSGEDGDEPVECVRAPMVGTFYRAPAPGGKPFVSEGDEVVVGQQVAVIESMKLMSPVESKVAGTVHRILVADATSVEYDQPLIEITGEG